MHQSNLRIGVSISFCSLLLLGVFSGNPYLPVHRNNNLLPVYRPPSPQQIIANAKGWVDANVDYFSSTDPETFYPNANGYRKDCSGFVSMAWQLPYQPDTDGLATISTPISENDLQPGDILLNQDPLRTKDDNRAHVVIFIGWTSNDHSQYAIYEESDYSGAHEVSTMPYPYYSKYYRNKSDYVSRRLDPAKVGTSTSAPINSIKPKGKWVSPVDTQVITNSLTFSAHAWPSHTNDPPIWFVKFTMNVHDAWQNACVTSPPQSGDVFSCDVDISSLFGNTSRGTTTNIQVSFDVFDQDFNKTLAPDGVRTINYLVLAPLPTPTSTPIPPTPTVTPVPPTPTLIQGAFPPISGTYNGLMTNTTVNEVANMQIAFNSVNADGSITGRLVVDPPLYGTGNFTGNISGSNIQFTVTPDNYPSWPQWTFTGTVNSDGNSMNGSYVYPTDCQSNCSGGIWNVSH
jgi:hypothetical protein